MKQICVILVSTLILVSNCLHIKYHESTPSYLSALQSQQSSLTTQIPTINTQIAQTLQQVAAQLNIQNKIKILEQAILKQKAQLSALSITMANPLNETTWTCQNYIGTSQQQITTLSSNIITSTNTLSQTINSISNSTITPYFTPDANSAVTVAQTIQKDILATGGTQVQSLNTTNITNLLSTNWVTGNNGTIQQVDQQLQNTNQNNGYVLTCPLFAPYFDGANCIGCPNNLYFNIQTKKCVNCDIFNATTHTCTSNTSTTTNTTTNTTINTNASTTTYNGTNLQGLNRTILPSNVTVSILQNTVVSACPSAYPFYANNQCINCLSPTPLFNYSSQQCTTCPIGANYIPDQHICLSPQVVYVTNLPASSNSLILPNNVTISDLQSQQQNSSSTQLITPCPIDKPFFNNQSCINCNVGQYFNIAKLKCQTCPTNTKYNVTMHQCIGVTYYSNLTNRNWTSTNPNNVRITVANSSTAVGATMCPADTPFFDGTKCVGCTSGQFFNFDVNKCQSCPADNVFDANLHSCVISKANVYQTNPATAPNLIYAGTSKGQWMTMYFQNQQNRQDCPQNLPYFDGITCINCPDQFPYFNLRYQVCQTCDIGSTYDQAVHQCLSSSGDIISQQPNIQKMVASIFT